MNLFYHTSHGCLSVPPVAAPTNVQTATSFTRQLGVGIRSSLPRAPGRLVDDRGRARAWQRAVPVHRLAPGRRAL